VRASFTRRATGEATNSHQRGDPRQLLSVGRRAGSSRAILLFNAHFSGGRSMRNPDLADYFFGGELKTLNLLPHLPRVPCPTLVINGEDDPVTTIHDAEEVAAAIPSGLVRFERFSLCGPRRLSRSAGELFPNPARLHHLLRGRIATLSNASRSLRGSDGAQNWAVARRPPSTLGSRFPRKPANGR
jgi:hypothetical protein